MKKWFWSVPILAIALVWANSQEESRDSLLQRARDGDAQAVLEIGRSVDPQAIAMLLQLFHEPAYNAKREVRVALAKAGDRQALQYFACRSMSDSVEGIEALIKDDLDYIGGGFAVQIYRQLLDSDQRFLPDMDRTDRNSDALLRFPGSTAVLMLGKLFPSVVIPKPSPLMTQAGNDHDIRAKWADWIDQREDEIRKIQPNADGISFESSYCSHYDVFAALDRRLRTLSGEGATNCGNVEVEVSAVNADKCVKSELHSKSAFFVRYDVHDADEQVAVGLAAAPDGTLYAIAYDDVGVSTIGLADKAEVTDGGYGVVVRCPRPISLRPSISKGLTCINREGNPLLSPE